MEEAIYHMFNKVDSEKISSYSKQKYGDVRELEKYIESLSKLISQNKLIAPNTVIFVGVKSPYSEKYKKNFVILSEGISKLVNLPIVYAFYHYDYNPKTFYDNQTQRKAVVPKLSNSDRLKYQNYNFIVIEDSVITGTTLKAITESLNGLAKSITTICILDLRGEDVIEREVNDSYFRENGVKGLELLFKQEGYIPTTQMIRTIETLNDEEIKYLLKNIPDPQNLLDSYRMYLGRQLKL